MIEHKIAGCARGALGEDYLGIEAVRIMEDQFRNVGVDVTFILDEQLEALRPFEVKLRKLRAAGVADWKITTSIPDCPYTENDLAAARFYGEMLVLRPRAMIARGYDTRGYDRRGYFQGGSITPGWALVTKAILPESKTDERQDPLEQYRVSLRGRSADSTNVRQRTALETAYDNMLRYVNTGKILLPDSPDQHQTKDKYDEEVVVNYLRQALRIGWHIQFGNIGVYANR